jgi:hypothetical protein
MSQPTRSTSGSSPTQRGSPDDGPVRAETGRDAPQNAGFVSQTNGNNGKKPSSRGKKKVKVTKEDYYLFLLTYYNYHTNGSFTPWNNKAWNDLGPKRLLARHSSETCRNMWYRYEKEIKWLIHIEEAIKWSATPLFQAIAAEDYSKDAWLMVLYQDSAENVQKLNSLIKHIVQTYGTFFPLNREKMTIPFGREEIKLACKKAGIRQAHEHTTARKNLVSRMDISTQKPTNDGYNPQTRKSEPILIKPGPEKSVTRYNTVPHVLTPGAVPPAPAPRQNNGNKIPLASAQNRTALPAAISAAMVPASHSITRSKNGEKMLPRASQFDDHFEAASDNLWEDSLDFAGEFAGQGDSDSEFLDDEFSASRKEAPSPSGSALIDFLAESDEGNLLVPFTHL